MSFTSLRGYPISSGWHSSGNRMKPFHPGDIGLFGADGVVFEPDGLADLVQEFPGTLFHLSIAFLRA